MPLLALNGYIQEIPEENPLFNDSEVVHIGITINPEYLQTILQAGNEKGNTDYPATFNSTSSKFTTVVKNVGFRLRSNTSRYAQKKSFKVSFTTFGSIVNKKGFYHLPFHISNQGEKIGLFTSPMHTS